MKPVLYVVLIFFLLYVMDVRIIVDFIDNSKETWNYIADYVLTFRYKQPVTFIALPVIAIWLLGKK